MKITRYTTVDFDGLTLVELASKVEELRAIYGDAAVFNEEDEWGRDRLCISYEDEPTETERADMARKAEEEAVRKAEEEMQRAEMARMRKILAQGELAREERIDHIAAALARYEEARAKAGERE